MATVDLVIGRISRTDVFTLPAAYDTSADVKRVFNNGATLLLVDNVGGSTRNATIVIEQTVDGQPVDDMAYAVPANSSTVLGPYPRSIYGDHLMVSTDHDDLEIRAFSLL